MEKHTEVTLLGVFDCIFDPPYGMGPADSEWCALGFIAHCASKADGLTGNGVDLIGGSYLEDINFTDESPSGLRLRFRKVYHPGPYNLLPITYELSSPRGWQKQYPQNEKDDREFAILDGMYTTANETRGRVALVVLNYRPSPFIWHEELRKILALRGDVNEAAKQLLEILHLSRTP